MGLPSSYAVALIYTQHRRNATPAALKLPNVKLLIEHADESRSEPGRDLSMQLGGREGATFPLPSLLKGVLRRAFCKTPLPPQIHIF